jgi:hypothetical protein
LLRNLKPVLFFLKEEDFLDPARSCERLLSFLHEVLSTTRISIPVEPTPVFLGILKSLARGQVFSKIMKEYPVG